MFSDVDGAKSRRPNYREIAAVCSLHRQLARIYAAEHIVEIGNADRKPLNMRQINGVHKVGRGIEPA